MTRSLRCRLGVHRWRRLTDQDFEGWAWDDMEWFLRHVKRTYQQCERCGWREPRA